MALDRTWNSLCEIMPTPTILRVVGDSGRLPIVAGHFDLVFCQIGFLWMWPLESIAAEIWRVLGEGGVFLSIEPDFQSLIEFPPEIAIKDIWISALRRAGANLEASRRAPSILESLGFRVRVDLLDRIHPPSPLRFEFLREMPLTDEEHLQINASEIRSKEAAGWSQLVHLPFMLTTAEKT
jgi:SAM-dependent methyltransferase